MTEHIEGLSIGLDLETLQLERGLTGLKDRMKTLNSEMKANLSTFDRGEKSIEKYETTIQGLNKKIELQRRIVSESRAEYEKMVKEFGEGSKQAENAARAYNNQVSSLNSLYRNINQTRDSLDELNDATNKSKFSFSSFGEALKGAAKNAGGFALNATKMGSAVGSFAPVLATAAGGALGLSSSFAAAGAGAVAFGAVATSVLGNVFDSTEELEKAQEKLDEATNPEERKKALAEIEKIYAGMSKGQREAVKDLQGFKSFWGDFTKQFEEPIFEGFGKGLDIAENVLNKLAPTIRNVADVTNELLGSLGNAVNSSEATKFFDWLATNAGEALRSFGQIAGNAVGGVLNLLRAFTPVGVSMEKGLVNLSDKFKQWSSTLENSKSFQTFIGFVKTNGLLVMGALGDLFGIILNVGKVLAPVLGVVSNAVFTLIGKLLEWLNNLRLSADQANSFRETVVNAFQSLKTFVQPAIAAVSSFIGQKIKEIKAFWDSDGQQFVQAIKNAFNMIQSVVSFVMPVVLAIVKSVWGNIQGVISGALNIIMGLVKVFSGLFTGDFSKLWEGIKQIFSGSIEFIWNFIQLNMFGKLLSLGKIFIGSFKGIFVGLWNGLKSLFTSSAGAAKNAVVAEWNALKSGTSTIFNGVKSFLTGIWDFLKTKFTQTATNSWNAVKTQWNALKSGTTNIFNSVKSFLSGIWDTLKTKFTQTATNSWNAVKTQWNALKSGTTNIFNSVKRFLTGIWDALKTKFTQTATNSWNAVKAQWNALKSGTTSIFNNVKRFLTGIWDGIKTSVSNLAGKAKDGVVNAWSTMRNRTTEIFTNIKSKVSGIFNDIVSAAKNLPGRIGSGIKAMAGKVKDGVSAVGKKLAGGLESVLNTITQKGINVVLDKIGVSSKNQIPALNIPGYKNGTDGHPKDGPAFVGDGGEKELLRLPNGNMFLSPNKTTLIPNMPKGTEVLSGKQTRQFFSAPMYSKGTDQLADGAKKAYEWAKDKGSQAVNKGKDLAGKVSDSIGDVWSYISNPKKLVDKIWKTLSLKMPNVGGIMGQIAKSGVSKIKDGAVGFLQSKLSEFMPSEEGSFTGIGGYYLNNPFRITTRFTPNGNKNDKVHKGGVHNGLDLAAPAGTIIKSLTDGIVRQVLINNPTGGNLVRIASGKDLLSYAHMLSAPLVKVGQKVKEGQKIGLVGSTGFSTGNHLDLKIKRNGKYIDPLAYLKGMSSSGPAGKGAKAWRSTILKAAAQMNEKVSERELNGIIAQIDRESKGNEKIIQDSRLRDINVRNGNPAKGLLQYIPQSFSRYAVKGHTNIFNGYDQLLAWFNNTSWRKNLKYGRSGWGPTGKRKYKNGTGLMGHFGGDAILGDGFKVEPFLLPDGRLGLSPDSPTLFNDMPKGTKVWSSVQDFFKEYAGFANSAKQSSRTDAMKLLALAGKRIQANSSQNASSSQTAVSSTSNTDSVTQKTIELLQQQVELLQALLMKDPEIAILLDGKSVAKGIYKDVTEFQNRKTNDKIKFQQG
jgi:murein DD-endopeptidase MepM/ murein hydrolase activator NlpD/phage-related protein/SLT domain-containing protein